MSKYSKEFKLDVVKHYASGADGFRTTGAKFAIDKSLVRRWVDVHKCLGPDGFGSRYERRTAEFKLNVLKQIQSRGLSLREARLNKAFGRLKAGDKPLVHSDQGWQYQMRHYQQKLKERGLEQSMSRKGNCLDNAVMENFFGILKTEFFHGKKFESVESFKTGLDEYMMYYNHDRIKEKLKGLSPVQYRIQSLKVA